MYQEPNIGPAKTPIPKTQSWKWEKRHTLLLIGLACLVLWWLAPSLKTSSWFQSSLNLLPLIGSLAFASETILKLIN